MLPLDVVGWGFGPGGIVIALVLALGLVALVIALIIAVFRRRR